MTDQKNTTIYDVEDLLRKLRDSQNNTQFEIYLSEAWRVLGFDGAPDTVSFDAFMINAICESAQSGQSTPANKARRRDVALMSYGLLEGYRRTELVNERKNHVNWKARHLQYLRNSDYVKRDYPKELEKVATSNYKKGAWKYMNKIYSSYFFPLFMEYIESLLHHEGKLQECMDEGIRKFTYEEISSTGDKVSVLDLPKPCYTLERFPKLDNDSNSSSDSSNINEDYEKEKQINVVDELKMRTTLSRQTKMETGFILLAVCIAFLCILCLRLSFMLGNQNEIDPLEPKSVEFEYDSEKDGQIILSPGEHHSLKVITDPEGASIDKLDVEIEPENAPVRAGFLDEQPELDIIVYNSGELPEAVKITLKNNEKLTDAYVNIQLEEDASEKQGHGKGQNVDTNTIN